MGKGMYVMLDAYEGTVSQSDSQTEQPCQGVGGARRTTMAKI